MQALRLISILLLWMVSSLPATMQENPVPRFEPVPCPIEFSPRYTVECGYLVVAEEHATPDGATIRVMLAIFRTDERRGLPDPLIYLSGGPGSHTLETFVGGLGGYLDHALQNRDVILIDQRGIGFSEPSLDCPEIDALYLAATMGPRSVDLPVMLNAAKQCFERLIGEGVNIAAFNTVESAADVAAIAPALGYEQVNIYGGSYGSTLAMTVMRNHPNAIRSVMLQGITPPQIDLMASFPLDFEYSLNMLFEACAADEACNAAFPNLEAMFYEIVARLNDEPLKITVTNPLSSITTTLTADGDDLVRGMQSAIYSSSFLPQFPLVIAALYNEQYSVLEGMVMDYLRGGATSSEGAMFAMRCMDDVMTTTDAMWEESVAGVNPALQPAFWGDIEEWEVLCANWGARQLDPVENTPVVSDIPTLILNGAYDPVTPAVWGEFAVETLSNGYNYTFPADGHGVFPKQCAVSIFDEFITDPSVAPNADCLNTIPNITFALP